MTDDDIRPGWGTVQRLWLLLAIRQLEAALAQWEREEAMRDD